MATTHHALQSCKQAGLPPEVRGHNAACTESNTLRKRRTRGGGDAGGGGVGSDARQRLGKFDAHSRPCPRLPSDTARGGKRHKSTTTWEELHTDPKKDRGLQLHAGHLSQDGKKDKSRRRAWDGRIKRLEGKRIGSAKRLSKLPGIHCTGYGPFTRTGKGKNLIESSLKCGVGGLRDHLPN